MDFSLDETQRLLVRTATELAEAEFAQRAFTWEGEFPRENLESLAENGLLGIALDESYGGGGLTPVEVLLVQEAIGRVCPDTAHIVSRSSMGAPRAIDELGTSWLKERYLPPICNGESIMSIAISEAHAGSDASAMSTTATVEGDEVVIDGRKHWVTKPDVADAFLVYAKFADGIGAVVIEETDPGFEVERTDINMAGHHQGTLRFDDCRVPTDRILIRGGDAFITLLKTFNVERCHNAMMCVSVARNAFERALEYADEREQFGHPIGEFQAIEHKLADMAIAIETARLAVLYAAQTVNDGSGWNDRAQTSIAKVYANEVGEQVLTEAMQIFGANGYMRGHPVEYMYRLVRGWKIAGGTVEVQRNGIASVLKKHGYR